MKKSMQTLSRLNLRKTPIRKQLLKVFFDAENTALSSKEIETKLNHPDRITLYRTLKTFEEHGLIHQALDASGVSKYALCPENCTPDRHKHKHAHFHCLKCGKTSCIEEPLTIQIKIPKGYQLKDSHIILEGYCPECN